MYWLKRLIDCREKIAREFNIDPKNIELSMGMSSDFEIAVNICLYLIDGAELAVTKTRNFADFFLFHLKKKENRGLFCGILIFWKLSLFFNVPQINSAKIIRHFSERNTVK